ncbi:PREDICTED: high mobility group protein B2-like [Pterocles gutturalis]|uniref:high mobility group protein B2-like n=1 Tax=Pterocles gutturalis TaxID=240206 RepID=UPI00052895C9|nr:PREDICTED: high mobility group protein B2-like [Pterocles gutturalis]
MAWPGDTGDGGERSPRLLFYISIRVTNSSQQPPTSTETPKKRSKKRKNTSGEEGKNSEEMAEHHKTKHPKKRTSGPPRGVRTGQRRQRKRVSFATDKKPLPAFFLFMEQHRPELQQSNPHWTAAETAKRLGELWHHQPEQDKEMYKEQAAGLRRRNRERSTGQGTSQGQPGTELTAERNPSIKEEMKTLMVCFADKTGSLCNFILSLLQL